MAATSGQQPQHPDPVALTDREIADSVDDLIHRVTAADRQIAAAATAKAREYYAARDARLLELVAQLSFNPPKQHDPGLAAADEFLT